MMEKETRYAWLAAGIVFILGGLWNILMTGRASFWVTVALGVIFLGIAAWGRTIQPRHRHQLK